MEVLIGKKEKAVINTKLDQFFFMNFHYDYCFLMGLLIKDFIKIKIKQ